MVTRHDPGTATHLGAITWVSHEVVNLCSNPPGQVVGQITLTAADGDLVFGEYQALANLDFPGGQVTASGQLQITGGTGRFAGASGEGVISAVGSLAPPFALIGGITGVISY